jgi:glycine/D-amino acid oxidase-like deaminating enzyme
MRALSRRGVLQAAVALTAWPALAQDGGAEDQLAAPDFTKLRAQHPFVIGVRPHRKGGVRLEVDAEVRRATEGRKVLVHNYGHGGAGITLAFGTASAAGDLVKVALLEKRLSPNLAVVGTGVVGLATATELRRRYPKAPLTVYAKDLDVRSTTSFLAGGQFEPSGIFHEYEGDERKQLLGGWLRGSRDRIVELQQAGTAGAMGIVERRNFTLDHENRGFDEFTPLDVVPRWQPRRLPFEKLDVPGREYATWLLNPTLLLPRLAADLAASGVTFTARTFATVDELLALPQNVIVNATGLGAKALVSDAAVVPQRGHLVVLQRTDPRQNWFFSGGCANPAIAYAFCRQDDIVLGGSVHSNQDSSKEGPKDQLAFKLLRTNLEALFAGQTTACNPL